MKIAYFDCFAGISGDMFLGALIDAGLDQALLAGELARLPLEGYRLEFDRVERGGIQATRFKVILARQGGDRQADSEYTEVDSPGEDSAGVKAQGQAPVPGEHGGHRTLPQIVEIIESSSMSPRVKTRAAAIFTRLAEAESRVHGVSVDQVQFHEVGAVDAILDIVGAAIGLEQLGIEAVYASPLHLGAGFVRSQHGLLPVPGPATAYLLHGIPAYTSQAKGELVTPTGAAIITTIARGFGPMPLMVVQAVGYGAGRREREFPNTLRVFLGEEFSASRFAPAAETPAMARAARDPFPEQHDMQPGPGGYHEGPAVVIEANIDDMNPQLCEHLAERLFEIGALDVLWVPAHMKKGRPGMLLHVLAHPDSVDGLLAILFAESTSIGARTYPVIKRMLQREVLVVETPYGRVRVKVARLGERVVNVSPEYEDCRQVARVYQIPLKEVITMTISAARDALARPGPGMQANT